MKEKLCKNFFGIVFLITIVVLPEEHMNMQLFSKGHHLIESFLISILLAHAPSIPPHDDEELDIEILNRSADEEVEEKPLKKKKRKT